MTMPPHPRMRIRRLSPIWLIPLVAAAVAGYLVWNTVSQRGPVVTVTFDSGEGIVPGQTKVQHKAVPLGTVTGMTLSPDLRTVQVRVQMDRGTAKYLTTNTKFWVVRARFNAGQVSGLETLVSGSYLDFDPGPPDAAEARTFQGLEQPPAVRSDEPGRSYTLLTDQAGTLSSGSPVFYRSIQVGEVLGHDQPSPDQPVAVRIFVRAPFDQYVRPDTHFWNVSGVSVQMGPNGVHMQMESLRAVLAGGVAFDAPTSANAQPPSSAGAQFRLYSDATAANDAGTGMQIPFVSYFTSSVSGLAKGSPVEVFGIQVGTVTDVGLRLNTPSSPARVRVAFEVRADRLFSNGQIPHGTPAQIAQDLLRQGMKVELGTSNYLTGQQVLTLQFPNGGTPDNAGAAGITPGAAPSGTPAPQPTHARFAPAHSLLWLAAAPTEAPTVQEAAPAAPATAPTAPTLQGAGPSATTAPSGAQQPVVLPSEAGSVQALTQNLSRIVAKLDQLPLAEIGAHLNHTLSTLDTTLGSPELQQTLHNFNVTSAEARDLMGNVNARLTPLLDHLPALTGQLQGTVANADKLMGSLNSSYGGNSEMHAELQQLLWQTNETMRSVRLLADFLTRHPEALLTGRAGGASK